MLAADRRQATASAVVPEGRVELAGRLAGDPVPADRGRTFAFEPTHLRGPGGWSEWSGPRLVVAGGNTGPEVAAGDRVRVVGSLGARSGTYRGDPVAGWMWAVTVDLIGPPSDPLFTAANLARRRIAAGLESFAGRPAAGLLAGFLIGDVRGLPDADREALQRSGLSHFVAVSGSNVALFLAGWWLVAGPLGWGPRRRAVLGLAGVVLFCVITRGEPSVVRASTMAGVALVGRLAGVPVSGWVALGTATCGLLLVSADLAVDLGFQLSVAATAGVLAGAGVFGGRRPRWLWTALGATLAAQAAVAPLLLVRIGTLPLAAPVANVLAAPLVGFATAVGGIGVLAGLDAVTASGLAAADLVLQVARVGADLPQLGPAGTMMVAGMGVLAWRRRLRPFVAIAGAAALGWTAMPHGGPPPVPEVVVLDVSQGDAVLLRDPGGAMVLIDGGPDPAVLRAALRRWGVHRIDLLVITDEHADHVAGLVGITGMADVGKVWRGPRSGELLDRVVAELWSAGVPVAVPEPGWRAAVGGFSVGVIGPVRRYASPNDESIVLWVEAAGRTVLLAGDVEAFAQADLGPRAADVMKVPHQGAATSDLEWLAASAPRVAVISVGPNDHGHPSPEVVAVLEAAGARVVRTDHHGDVVIRLGS